MNSFVSERLFKFQHEYLKLCLTETENQIKNCHSRLDYIARKMFHKTIAFSGKENYKLTILTLVGLSFI